MKKDVLGIDDTYVTKDPSVWSIHAWMNNTKYKVYNKRIPAQSHRMDVLCYSNNHQIYCINPAHLNTLYMFMVSQILYQFHYHFCLKIHLSYYFAWVTNAKWQTLSRTRYSHRQRVIDARMRAWPHFLADTYKMFVCWQSVWIINCFHID